MTPDVSFGFPRMHEEPSERRDFLPQMITRIAQLGCPVVVEHGIGTGMGFRASDYASAPGVRIATMEEAFAQDIVVVLRAPVSSFDLLRPGATLISMLHVSTQPERARGLAARGIDAISLDAITDEAGRRLVENAAAVAWNGLDAAFGLLEDTWPELATGRTRPVRATLLGAGAIGRHAVEAGTKYGSLDRAARFARAGLPGVEVTTLGRNLTAFPGYLADRLTTTDVLVDATRRDDPSTPLVPNEMIGRLPAHAVICDLVVDPYVMETGRSTVRGIEGIPQGNLDHYRFDLDDPAWDTVPASHAHRRRVVSCYSWPGIRPLECMELYGRQLLPLIEALVERGGPEGVRPDGSFVERALARATLGACLGDAA